MPCLLDLSEGATRHMACFERGKLKGLLSLATAESRHVRTYHQPLGTITWGDDHLPLRQTSDAVGGTYTRARGGRGQVYANYSHMVRSCQYGQ